MCALAVCSVARCLRLLPSSLAVVHAWAARVAFLVFLWCFTRVSWVLLLFYYVMPAAGVTYLSKALHLGTN
jgi:hypothetical protein